MDEETLSFELNDNWLGIHHAARYLAAQRLGVDPVTKPVPSLEDRMLALVLWRDYLRDPQDDSPTHPMLRALTAEEREWAERKL